MEKLALFFCMTAGVMWAGSGVAAQHFFAHSHLNAMDLTTFRMFCTSFIMAAVTLSRGHWRRNWTVMKREPGLWLQILFYGLVGLMAMHFAYFEAIDLGNAAVVTVIQYTCPAMVICWLAFQKRAWPEPGSAIAVGMAILGTFLLVTGGHLDALSISRPCLIWAVASAVFYAVAAIFPKHLTGRLDNSFLLTWGMLFGAVASWLMTDHLNFLDFFHAELLFDLFVIVVCGTAVAFICYNVGLEYLSADQASLTTTVEPVASVVMSYFLFGTTFGLVQTGGIILIVAAIALPVLWRRRAAR
mgnify:CR=1 FL=1